MESLLGNVAVSAAFATEVITGTLCARTRAETGRIARNRVLGKSFIGCIPPTTINGVQPPWAHYTERKAAVRTPCVGTI